MTITTKRQGGVEPNLGKRKPPTALGSNLGHEAIRIFESGLDHDAKPVPHVNAGAEWLRDSRTSK